MNGLIIKLKNSLIILCLLGIPALLAAQNAADLFAGANRAYAEGRFGDAISGYGRLVEQKNLSSSIFFNLGNAYYKKGDIAKAVLQYERGLLLSPSDPDIRANLETVRKSAGLAELPVLGWAKPFLYFNLNAWTWFAFISFLTLTLAYLIRNAWLTFHRKETCPRASFALISVVCALCLLVSLVGIGVQAREMSKVVVTESGATLKVSPFDSAENIASLRPGEVMRVLKKYDQFFYVENEGGGKGWVLATQVENILPSS